MHLQTLLVLFELLDLVSKPLIFFPVFIAAGLNRPARCALLFRRGFAVAEVPFFPICVAPRLVKTVDLLARVTRRVQTEVVLAPLVARLAGDGSGAFRRRRRRVW